jgi:CheY-like chemotaxis protein
MVFEPEGYEVVTASDGRKALLKIEREAPPDLIFLDYNMSVMDGTGFLNELERTHPDLLTRIPIIMLTGTEPHLVTETRASEIVPKQLGVEHLLSLVRRYLHEESAINP